MELEIKSLYTDFFDYIIWDVLKPLIGNISLQVPLDYMKKEIRDIFIEGALIYRVDYDKISNILKENRIQEPILDYIIDMLSKFGNKLDSYFLKDLKDHTSVYKGKELESILRDFNSIISEYVLISYFDLVVLKQVISLLTYGSDLTHSEVYHFRVKCLDIFKTAINENIDLGIGDVLTVIREQLEDIIQEEKLIDLILVQFFSFFEFVVSTEDINTIIPLLKYILSLKIYDYRQVTPFISSNDIDIITEWFSKQVIDLPISIMHKLYSLDNMEFDFQEIQNEFLELFKLFIKGTVGKEKLEKFLIEAGKKIGFLEKIYQIEDNILEFFEMDQSLDLVKNHSLNKIRTKFDFNIPGLPKHDGDKKVQENVSIIIILRVFDNILAYCEFIDNERSIDPSLIRLVSYIKNKIQIADTMYI